MQVPNQIIIFILYSSLCYVLLNSICIYSGIPILKMLFEKSLLKVRIIYRIKQDLDKENIPILIQDYSFERLSPSYP